MGVLERFLYVDAEISLFSASNKNFKKKTLLLLLHLNDDPSGMSVVAFRTASPIGGLSYLIL